MKTRSIFLILFFACQAIFAQTNTGISVQGIARDAKKAALVDVPLTFIFDIQEASGGTSYYMEDVEIMTDPYGVFSHIVGTGNVLSAGAFNDIPFGKTHMKLVISVEYKDQNIVISNSPFQYAPYAKNAENGVPTGTIVAFLGKKADVPRGWTLCDGTPLSEVEGSVNLEALIGPNAPDLRGMFLRGIGSGANTSTAQAGPAQLKDVQQDGFKTHNLTGTTNAAGKHSHYFYVDTDDGGDPQGYMLMPEDFGNFYANTTQSTSESENHTHTVTGSSSGGIDETRPVNYGVNYIIKL